MNASALPSYLYDTLFRLFPHRAPTGLIRIGGPGRDAPVLVTGNYTLTVRRLVEALEGLDVWLLVANSGGINVWCAAGGGHLTHHDVIAAVRTSGIGELVDHRTLVLPQLGATGIERGKIMNATGWTAVWGPARLEDLPGCIRRGGGATRHERIMRFPLWERLEMAVVWAFPMTVILAPLFGLLGGWDLALITAAVIPLMVFGVFAALPGLQITGRLRWLTFGGVAVAGYAAAGALLVLVGDAPPAHHLLAATACVGAMAILAVDLTGTTPWYASHVNTFANPAHIELLADRCTGAADCVQVCPRGVLEMNGGQRKVEIVRGADCIECAACIVQCPADALRLRYRDGRLVEPDTIRRTRLNLLGKRTVRVDAAAPSAASR